VVVHRKPSAAGPHAPARDGSQPQLAVAPAPPTNISHGAPLYYSNY
jgi:hypothetical protein